MFAFCWEPLAGRVKIYQSVPALMAEKCTRASVDCKYLGCERSTFSLLRRKRPVHTKHDSLGGGMLFACKTSLPQQSEHEPYKVRKTHKVTVSPPGLGGKGAGEALPSAS